MTLVFGIFTVIFMPVSFWIARKLGNAIENYRRARNLTRPTLSKDSKNAMNLEALITIFETNEMASQPRTVAERLKVLSSLTLSKTLYFGIFVSIIFLRSEH